MDILCFNRYDGWSPPGDMSHIISNTVKKAELWHTLHNKPVVMSEYGGENYGIHSVSIK